jgi:hypothetical protein
MKETVLGMIDVLAVVLFLALALGSLGARMVTVHRRAVADKASHPQVGCVGCGSCEGGRDGGAGGAC